MRITRLTTLSLLAVLAAACGGEKVQPEGANADSTLTPEQREAKSAAEYRKKQAAFADSVLGNSKNAAEMAKSLGKGIQVGTVQMRDSLVKFVQASPQCFKQGRDVDPYLAGTATFYIHMSVVGSDVVRIQKGDWTSPAGTIVEKCFADITPKWKFPMGMARQGEYVLQVQFK